MTRASSDGAALLAEFAARLGALPPAKRDEVAKDVLDATKDYVWVPNPGPQTAAYFCQADELFYGGEAGGGKTDLLVGLALTQHKKSLVLRRLNKEVDGLAGRFEEVIGSRDAYNSQKGKWRLDRNRIIDLGGCQHEGDKQGYKGNPHDLIGFDEVGDFTESQYEFIIGWNRSVDKKQRCRVVAAGNPPTTPEGMWVVRRWAAWLDPRHPNPAEEGELRWFTTGENGKEIEVDGAGPHLIGSELVNAKSRTFIRSTLADNPDLAETDYDRTLAALPEEYRDAYRDGRFDRALRDAPFQCIPSSWAMAAQARWTPDPPVGVPMTGIGVDVAQGGDDRTVLAPRYDGWFSELIVAEGKSTPTGSEVAALIVGNRRDGASIILDMGGGFGGQTMMRLRDNGIECHSHVGANKATGRTADKKLGFSNLRSQIWWRLREALDPDQPGGSPVSLPPDRELLADLTAPQYEIGPHGIKVEPKESVVKRLGRSPDRGDAVAMAWSQGDKHLVPGQPMRVVNRRVGPIKVNVGYASAKKGRAR
jgi:hypothetical protein